jgi:hypothetical protein
MSRYQCSLYGVVSKKFNDLISRLEGICEYKEDFYMHEQIFSLATSVADDPSQTFSTSQDIILRLTRLSENVNDSPNYLCNWGPVEPRHSCNVRSILQIDIEGNCSGFLQALGYHYQFQYVKKGLVFLFKDSIKITVSNVYVNENDLTNSKLCNGFWFVEVHSKIVEQEAIGVTCDLLQSFSTFLTGIISLSPADHRFFNQKIEKQK